MNKTITKLVIKKIEAGEIITQELQSILFKLKFLETEIYPQVGEENLLKYFTEITLESLKSGNISTKKISEAVLYTRFISNTSGTFIDEIKRQPHMFKILNSAYKLALEKYMYLCNESIKNSILNNQSFKNHNILQKDVKHFSLSIIEHLLSSIEIRQKLIDRIKIEILDNIDQIKSSLSLHLIYKIVFDFTDVKYNKYPALNGLVEQVLLELNNDSNASFRPSTSSLIKKHTVLMNSLSRDDVKKKVEAIFENIKLNQLNFSKAHIYSSLLGFNIDTGSYEKKDFNLFVHYELIENMITKEADNRNTYIYDWNKANICMQSELWKVYFVYHMHVHSTSIDFSIFPNDNFKKEIKSYLYHIYNPQLPKGVYQEYRNFMLLKDYFVKNRISTVLDFKKNHFLSLKNYLEHELKLSDSTIKRAVGVLSKICDYFINTKDKRYSKLVNYFYKPNFKNIEYVNTDYIPESILLKINQYKHELDERYLMMFDVFFASGMRAKEVAFLEIEKIGNIDESTGYSELKYIPYKVLNARRLKNLSDYHSIFINAEMNEKLQEYIRNNIDSYDSSGTGYVFVYKNKYGKGHYLPKSGDFCLSINKLIKKHNITIDGEKLWKFTSRQCRKTIACELINNGASAHQVSSLFGHLSTETTKKYYLEVNNMKLAELNSNFFKTEFEVILSPEQLKYFNEEDRKELYLGFLCKQREVEFGFCSKHISDGECGNRVGASDCAICTKLCTGKNYLDKWISLFDSEKKFNEDLTNYYIANGIKEYANFIEYKNSQVMLNRYENVITAIMKGE